jgi:DNA repair protein RecO
MASNPEVFKGIILKTSEYKEKDRMIQVLTRERGIVNICVKGVSGKTSKVSFVSLPYSYCDFTVTDSHGFYYLKEGSVISGNTGIMDSLETMAVAGHIAECLSWTVMQSENARDCYDLAIYAYYALSIDTTSYLKVLIAFNWKLMWILGLASSASECAGTAGSSHKLNNRAYEILDYIGSSPVSKIFTIKLEEDDIRMLRGFTMDFLRVQLEKDIPDPILKLNLPGGM